MGGWSDCLFLLTEIQVHRLKRREEWEQKSLMGKPLLIR